MYTKVEGYEDSEYGESVSVTVVDDHPCSPNFDHPDTAYTLWFGQSSFSDGLQVSIVDRAGTDDELEVPVLRLSYAEIDAAIRKARGEGAHARALDLLHDEVAPALEQLAVLRPEIEALPPDAEFTEQMLRAAYPVIRTLRQIDTYASNLYPDDPDVLAFRSELRTLTAWLPEQRLPHLAPLEPTNELES